MLKECKLYSLIKYENNFFPINPIYSWSLSAKLLNFKVMSKISRFLAHFRTLYLISKLFPSCQTFLISFLPFSSQNIIN